jgi:hypothetical protein
MAKLDKRNKKDYYNLRNFTLQPRPERRLVVPKKFVVKIFSFREHRIDHVEESINSFLAEKSDSIRHVLQSSGDQEGICVTTITIFYEEEIADGK